MGRDWKRTKTSKTAAATLYIVDPTTVALCYCRSSIVSLVCVSFWAISPQLYRTRVRRLCAHEKMQIFIKTLTGRKQALNFEPENQILAVKQALQEKEGIQVDQIKLIHSGKQLADNNTLEFYNITAGATLHLVLQLRGGMM